MTYQTHSIFGILTMLVITKSIGSFFAIDLLSLEALLLYPAVIVGALLPDIDIENSKISSNLKPIAKIINWLGFKHRGLTHSLLGGIILNLPFYALYRYDLIPKIIFTGLVIGYLSHLLADMLNPTGVPLFYPFRKKFSIFIIPTSSKAEAVFKAGITIAVIVLLVDDLGIINILK